MTRLRFVNRALGHALLSVPLFMSLACGSGTDEGDQQMPTWPPVEEPTRPSLGSSPPAPTQQPGQPTAPPVTPAPVNPTPVGGPCDKAPKATAAEAGKPPSVYGSAWTPAPTEACTFTDGDGRTVNLTAEQHRMLYRVNEVRALQSAADGRKRGVLEADFCLQEFSQAYAASSPGGHSAMNLSFYAIPGGGQGTGGNFIGENYGAHGGYTKDPMAAVDKLIAGWWSSGGTDSGHRGNMLDPEWTKGGMGVVVKGSSALGLQTFSRKYANWLSGWDPCSKPPKMNDPMSTIPQPLKR